jgi:hypothetical protein
MTGQIIAFCARPQKGPDADLPHEQKKPISRSHSPLPGDTVCLLQRPVFEAERPLSNARRIRGSRGQEVPIERRR